METQTEVSLHLEDPDPGPYPDLLQIALEPDNPQTPASTSEETARQQLAELEAIYRTAPVGLCVIDRQLRFVRVNERLAEINGVPARDHVGRYVRDVVPGLVDPAERLMRQVMESGDPVLDVEVRGETPARPGEERIWLESWYPLRGAEGEILGVNVVAEEVTERRRVEAERVRLTQELLMERSRLQEAKREAEEANEAKTNFLTSMSHDLRTPLNAVSGYVDLLEMEIYGPITEGQRNSLERIRLNQRVLLKMIEDVLHFAKLKSGQVEMKVEPVGLLSLLQEIEAIVGPQADRKGTAYTFERCQPGLRVLGDVERVRQIVLNLVTNAIKYTPPGGWVILGCCAVDGWGEVYVRDNGAGVAREMQEKIFDPFIQVDRTVDHPSEGIGMGLAISRRLARLMGGDLTVESSKGEGSTFRLRLPVA